MSESFYIDSRDITPEHRNELDIDSTNRVKAGFSPEQVTADHKPRIIDGQLEEDGQLALQELLERYKVAIQAAVRDNAWRVNNNPTMDRSDLYGEAVFGMLYAALRFDASYGKSFFGFSNESINRYIQSSTEHTATTVRLPINKRKEVRRARAIQWHSYQNHDHRPKRYRIALDLDIHPDRVDKLFEADAIANQMGSLNGGYFEDDRYEKSVYSTRKAHLRPIYNPDSEPLSAEDEAVASDLKQIFAEIFTTNTGYIGSKEYLSDKQIEVLRLRYIGGLTLQAIGEELGVTKQRAWQIESDALKLLRQPHYTCKFIDYFRDQD